MSQFDFVIQYRHQMCNSEGGIIMTYEKPKCNECGRELVLYEQFAFELETKINKNGIRSKRTQSSIPLSHSGIEWLRCTECCLQWEFKEDEKGRIIKVVS